MIEQFKENVLDGVYFDHFKGAELLDIDMEEMLLDSCKDQTEDYVAEIIELKERLKHFEGVIDDLYDDITNYQEQLHDH